jgi:D-glycero-alpha-D-manno-heptose-7-phosphate kinase
MIIARSPLRISLGGGGTDLPSYYERFGGFLIAGAIDKYVYVTLHQTFEPGLVLRYSKMERVDSRDKVEHPIIRESLKYLDVRDPNLEIVSLADIPAGTGLGSSGSFTTAMLKALHAHRRSHVSPHELAAQACEIEIEKLKEPIGKQDQYIAAVGGLTCFEFREDGSVVSTPLRVSSDTLLGLQEGLCMYFTGYSRKASTVLSEQKAKTASDDSEMLANLHYVKEMGLASKKAFEDGDLTKFGEIMHEHWLHKKKRSGAMSNAAIDEWYELGRKSGAVGGKLIGAGGGGFLLFYTENKSRLRKAMRGAGLREVPFRFDFEGTRIVNS